MSERRIQGKQHRDAAASDAEATVPVEWNVGDVILDTYEVKRIHEGGGMGLVYRVHHREWNMDLAVKTPRPMYFQAEPQKQNFVRECETWINLGLHPHIVSCFYVRTLGGIPRVFAEYVAGGSLSDWIRTRKLYAGGPEEALKRILDVAIQMAWGLHYAHEKGIIHQDVKPANVMMTLDGTARITDFGLAKARPATSETELAEPGRSLVVSTGGMTPAYCSPEQANGQPLTRRTDIWSWAVSVLEMLIGEVRWRVGPVAAEVLKNLSDYGGEEVLCCRVPSGLKDLLGNCLRQHQEQRPHDLAAVSEALNALCLNTFRKPFQRALPDIHDLDADALNNRVVSLIDLDRILTKETHNAYSLLLDLREKRPDHIRGRLNDALLHWRRLGMPVTELNRQLDNVFSSPFLPDISEWRIALELEKCQTSRVLHILDGSRHGARQSLIESAKQQHGRLRCALATFFQCQDAQPPRAYQALLAQDDETPPLFALAGADSGLAAIRMPDGRRITLKDIRLDKWLGEIAAPHMVTALGLSEHGRCLAVAGVLDKSDNKFSYCLSVYNPVERRILGSYVGEIPRYRLKAITIDDRALSITLWLESDQGVFELVHDLAGGALRPLRCDFRQPSSVARFDRVFLNGERTLLLCVSGSRCSLWRYPSATCDDSVNIMDIDLSDFGLIDTTGHLPGFELARGFEYRIDAWNAHRLMRLLNEVRPSARTGYLLCQPPDTRTVYAENAARKAMLSSVDDAESMHDRLGALCLLNRYCATLQVYQEPVMARRHALAHAMAGTHVVHAWHHSHHNWYWRGNIFGLLPAGYDCVALQWLSGLEICTLPRMERRNGIEWLDANRTEEFSVGAHDCGDGRVLALVHTRKHFCKNRLVLYARNDDGSPNAAWSVQIKGDEWPQRKHLQGIACHGETVYAELHPGIIEALDLKTGLTRGNVHVGDGVAFLQVLKPSERESVLFVACRPAGCVVLDARLKVCEGCQDKARLGQRLRPIEAVADDLSAVVGWLGPHRLVHVRLEDQKTTELWNRFEKKYENPIFPDSFAYKPEHIALSPCGRAVGYVLWNYVVVCDVLSQRTLLRWQRPWDKVNDLSFDGSGRWLVFAHAENQFEVFQLLWNVDAAPWASAPRASSNA